MFSIVFVCSRPSVPVGSMSVVDRVFRSLSVLRLETCTHHKCQVSGEIFLIQGCIRMVQLSTTDTFVRSKHAKTSAQCTHEGRSWYVH